jgi:ubiquitin-conjugating enzyme E2 O
MLSLQGLVLVREPFFNEAGYDIYVGTEEGIVKSIQYTETAFLLTLRTILFCLKCPPKPFEGHVKHFYHEEQNLGKLIERCGNLIEVSNGMNVPDVLEWFEKDITKFPLKRISKGCMRLLKPILQELSSLV